MTMFPQPAANAPQNWGEALRHVSPLLMAMSRGLGEGRGAMMYAPQGMAMMAQRDQAARDEAMRAEQMKWQRGMDQQRLAMANAQQGLEQQRFDMQRDQFDWDRTQQENAAKLSGSMIGGMDWLFQRESGGNFGAANSEGYVGRGQFGQDRLDDFSRAHGIGRISTDQFRGNPEMQKSVEAWHFADINDFVSQRGLSRFEGQQVNGVPVTRAGIVAMAHLGGKGGAARYLATGGKYDPADSNGTRLSDYLALGARATAQQAQAVMMHPGATAGQREMAQMILAQMQPAAPAERRIIEGADGYKYYEDTGERVLPGVEKTPTNRQTAPDAGGTLRYLDTGEAVFPGDANRQEPPPIEGESTIRKEFNAIPQIKAFSEQSQAFGRIIAAARDPSPAGDLALIFNYMKVLDPGSVVRESEFATAENAAAWLQRSEEAGMTVPLPVARTIRALATGQRLSSEQRQDFVSRAGALYDAAEAQYVPIFDQYTAIASAYGFTPDRALVDYRFTGDRNITAAPAANLSEADIRNMSDDELRALAGQ